MADIAVLDARIGESAGRIAPSSVEPVDGEYVLVLGDEGAREVTISGGDFTEVVQTVTAPAPTRLIRLGAALRGEVPPTSHAWSLSVLRDNVARVTIPLPVKERSRRLSDIAIPIADGGETFELALRLTIAGAGTDIEATLPAAQLDALTDDEGTALLAINRNPEPGETGVAVTTSIVVEVHHPGAEPVDLASVMVYVDHVLVFEGGSFIAPWTGSYALLDDDRTVHVELTPPADLAPLTTYLVSVTASIDPFDGETLDVGYLFTTEDLIAPHLLTAQPLDHTVVRVTFDEAMRAEDGSGTADALDPANWTITLLSTSIDDGLPAVPLQVVSVAAVAADPASFDLTLDWDMTPGALYRVTVAGTVEDLWDNPVDPAFTTADFTGYACPFPARRRFSLFNMLPELNRREDQAEHGGTRDLEKLVRCWQEITDLILCDIDRWTEILDPDIAPEAFVDAMLADLGYPFTFSLTTIEKRRLVRSLVAMYQKKGTADGIKDIVRFFFGIEVEVVVPWNDGIWILDVSELDVDTDLGTDDQALRYSFSVTCQEFLSDEQIAVITEIALYVKAAHEHLIGVFGLTEPPVIEHWQLNLSLLEVETILHA